MRAREFVINVPITIKINGDSDPEIDMDNTPDCDVDQDAWVSPQQQELELRKHELGKDTEIANQLLDDSDPDEIA